MKMRLYFLCACVGIGFPAVGLLAAGATNEPVTSPPVYVPDMSHANEPLPDGVLAWNSLVLTNNTAADEEQAHFVFSFTNIAATVDRTLTTNIMALSRIVAVTNSGLWRKQISFVTNFTTVTNVAQVTNSTPVPVTISDVHPSCGCTTAQLPQRPWTIPPGGTGEIPVTVNIGNMGPTLVKYITVTTDKGFQQLNMIINVLPPVVPTLSDAERARDVEIAKTDRQAVFKADCATCHAKSMQTKYGKPLYDAVCGICHDVASRASMVPDLHNLKTPTNDEFWRTWTAHGKPGSLMPAFSTTEGGPLTDMQISSLAAYLNSEIPSHVAPPQ